MRSVLNLQSTHHGVEPQPRREWSLFFLSFDKCSMMAGLQVDRLCTNASRASGVRVMANAVPSHSFNGLFRIIFILLHLLFMGTRTMDTVCLSFLRYRLDTTESTVYSYISAQRRLKFQNCTLDSVVSTPVTSNLSASILLFDSL